MQKQNYYQVSPHTPPLSPIQLSTIYTKQIQAFFKRFLAFRIIPRYGGIQKTKMYNPQEEKKQAKLFEKDFSPVALFLELVTTLFIINPNFLKKSQFFLKKATILFLFTNTSIIITYLLLFCYTQEEKKQIFLLYLSIYY